jgi:hypothetical protein
MQIVINNNDNGACGSVAAEALNFSIDPILPGTLWFCGELSVYWK